MLPCFSMINFIQNDLDKCCIRLRKTADNILCARYSSLEIIYLFQLDGNSSCNEK